MRSFASNAFVGLVRVSKISHPCFLAVEISERTMLKSCAPASERNPPDIFCLSFIMRASRSASVSVNGTAGSDRKRKTSGFRVCSRNKRLLAAQAFPGGGDQGWLRLMKCETSGQNGIIISVNQRE
jgi:hypothetical protein